MEFPIFQVPYLGNGMTIGLNAVLHVIISHGVAIGVMTMIAVSEYLGIKRSSRDWEDFSRDLLKPTVIVITAVGAVTGVGIWFFTSGLAPRGIGSLLRIFFWPWFIEWMAFTSEVILLLIFFFTWNSWTGERKRRHLYLGFGYVIFALFSMVLITGILGFMLTSDGWPWNKNFWAAFFNPSFVPQLLLRATGAFGLGALFSIAFLLFTRREDPFCKEALRLFGKIAFFSFLGVLLGTGWYFNVIPPAFKTFALFSVLTSNFSQTPVIFPVANVIAASLLLLLIFIAIRGYVSLSKVLILPILIISLGFVTEYERIREFIRGPYLMPGYMFTNQVLIEESPWLDHENILKHSFWYPPPGKPNDAVNQGAFLFSHNCSMCHTIGGINDIRKRVDGRTKDAIFVILGHTDEMIPFMPPFSGTDHERQILATFLYHLSTGQVKMDGTSRFVSRSGEK
jgi:mono/diheme cytochrome c family protein